jgi:hypothetical protein
MNNKKPDTLVDLRCFLCILNYYADAYHLQSNIKFLLTNFVVRRKISRTPAAESAFENCKTSLAQAALFFHPYPNAPLELITNASDVTLDASLEQKCDGHSKPPGFFSWKLTCKENRYCIYDQEVLAIYAAIKFFQYMLQDRDFVIKTTINHWSMPSRRSYTRLI